ncbi:MAG TPA: alpha/beta hydrolase [Rhodanobacteraceae bacterium]|nr:alpha/beta hydrolase [Rhodanobacteraceae bacterium]
MHRRAGLSLAFAFAVFAAPSFAAETEAPDPALDAYAKPGQRVDIGGRKLNLRCSGSGAPAVLLESGASADSLAWYLVQPRIAKTNKVCSYDRAGFGFSDDGPLPRDVDANAADLHALIHAAHIELPVVLVGHSLGTNIVRRYADKYAAGLAGLVLVDPPPQHISEFSADFVKADREMHEKVIAFATMCEKAASAGQLARPTGDAAQCIRPPNPAYPDALNAAIHAQKEKPPFWHTLISEFQTNLVLFEQPVSPKENHGALPLVVLTAANAFDDAPPEGKSAMASAQAKTHKLIVATSTRGEKRWIASSSHDMQLDQPDAIVTAVANVVSEAGSKSK